MVVAIDQFNKKAIERIDRLTNIALFANEHFKVLHDTRELFSNIYKYLIWSTPIFK